ncbi:MAG: hypothetical protein JNM31_04110 [Flavobacteriales bacterium]|nr:hypothetical protein [Flavobacteriales bacterium]
MELRTELKRLIEKEKDESLLAYALRFFKRADQEELWKAKLSSRADKAEADFAAGRTHTHGEVVAHFKAKRRK